MNFLESLAAEWYEYLGFFVRRNVRTRKRAAGGWDVELDVLALLPANGELVHIETSGDADSWDKRRQKFMDKKFVLSKREYSKLLNFDVKILRRVAIVGMSRSTKVDRNWAPDVTVRLIPEFVQEITDKLRNTDPMKAAVPEGFPILRTLQFVTMLER